MSHLEETSRLICGQVAARSCLHILMGVTRRQPPIRCACAWTRVFTDMFASRYAPAQLMHRSQNDLEASVSSVYTSSLSVRINIWHGFSDWLYESGSRSSGKRHVAHFIFALWEHVQGTCPVQTTRACISVCQGKCATICRASFVVFFIP